MKFFIYSGGLLPPNMVRTGGGVLKSVEGIMGVAYGVV